MMNRIVIADDHPIFRQGLRSMLAGEPDFEITADVDNGLDALDIIIQKKPDTAVLDISMPRMNGLDVIGELKQLGTDTKCIVLTMHNDAEMAATALRVGANGYILKTQAFDDLVLAIRTVAQGRKFISPQIAQSIAELPSLLLDRSSLTRREREILKLVASGLGSRDIAAKLNISEQTVKTHKAHIMGKLDIHSTAALVSYAIRSKLVIDDGC